jgi:hypothetical protein|tara:strand:- start:386 stop:565 length:180 start_codon:yes stop_codon:yes gene_type:complete
MTNEPKDLGVKFGTEESIFWEKAKKDTINEIKSCERTILMDKHILSLIEDKLAEEQLKK